MKKYFTKKNITVAFFLIAFGIIGRLLLQSFPNVETLMVVSILAGAMLGPYLGLVVALFSVIGSDVLIGNTSILFYTWSAWAIIGITSTLLKRKKDKVSVIGDSLKFTFGGVLGTLIFFTWTNFGVWQSGWLYPLTWDGLVTCYTMALPFLRNQLVGNLVIVPSVSLVFLAAWKYVPVLIQQRFKKKQLL